MKGISVRRIRNDAVAKCFAKSKEMKENIDKDEYPFHNIHLALLFFLDGMTL